MNNISSAMDLVADIFSHLWKLAAVVVVGVTAYYIYGTLTASGQLFRGLTPEGVAMSPQQFQLHVRNMELLTRLLLIASALLLLGVLGRYYDHIEAGAALAAVGLLMAFGMPFFIDHFGGPDSPLPQALRRFGSPRAYLKAQYQFAGLLTAGVALVHLVVHAVLFVLDWKNRRPQANPESAKTAAQVRKTEDRFLGKCWQLPFCRDTDKKLCPVRHQGSPCWRSGRGCYCDQNIILAISGGEYAASRGASGYLSRTASVVRPKTLSEKREQCLQCPVYLHHQGQKLQLLTAMVFAGLIGGLVLYWSNIKAFWPAAVHAVGRATSGFSFDSKAGTVPKWALELGAMEMYMWFFLILAVMLSVAYLLNAVEWILFRLGI